MCVCARVPCVPCAWAKAVLMLRVHFAACVCPMCAAAPRISPSSRDSQRWGESLQPGVPGKFVPPCAGGRMRRGRRGRGDRGGIRKTGGVGHGRHGVGPPGATPPAPLRSRPRKGGKEGTTGPRIPTAGHRRGNAAPAGIPRSRSEGMGAAAPRRVLMLHLCNPWAKPGIPQPQPPRAAPSRPCTPHSNGVTPPALHT